MSVQFMTVHLFEHPKIFQQTIDMFMAVSCFAFGTFVSQANIFTSTANGFAFTYVAIISFYHFPFSKLLSQSLAEDCQVMEWCWIWTIDPHNITSTNANCQLIAKCCMLDFFREVAWVPWPVSWVGFNCTISQKLSLSFVTQLGLADWKISSINSHLACFFSKEPAVFPKGLLLAKTILPFDLDKQSKNEGKNIGQTKQKWTKE